MIEIEHARFCTDCLPTGGVLKTDPEDFLVEEIPAYAPSGTGEHIMMRIRKRDLATDQVVRMLARHYGVTEGEVGTAGLKDRRAVTTQWFTVHAPMVTLDPPDLGDGVQVLEVSRHTNRLRTGHLRANRFLVRVRQTTMSPQRAADTARVVLARFSTSGMPNHFGPQRFGRDGQTASWGLAMLKDDRSGFPARVRRSGSLRRLALSAAQSLAYNAYLSTRIREGLHGWAVAGDVMRKLETGGMFNVEPGEIEAVQARLDVREIVHTGPMFGRKMFQSRNDAKLLEGRVLDSLGLTEEDFAGSGKLLPGTRRADIVLVSDTNVTGNDDGFTASFTLPAGSYATVLLEEITGTQPG